MLFANVCAGFFRLCCGVGGERGCLGTLGAPSGSAHLGVLALLIYPLVCPGPELRRSAYRWTRPSGGVRRGHCLRGSLGVHRVVYLGTFTPRSWRRTIRAYLLLQAETMEVGIEFVLYMVGMARLLVVFLQFRTSRRRQAKS